MGVKPRGHLKVILPGFFEYAWVLKVCVKESHG